MNRIDSTHSKTPKWQISISIWYFGLKCKLRYWTFMLEAKKNFSPVISANSDRLNLGIWAHFVQFCNSYVVPNFKTFIIFYQKGILGENFCLAFIKYIFLEFLIWSEGLTLLAFSVFSRKCRLRFMHIYCFNLPNFLNFCF